jgi:predicted dinucleotide-binding enzyme
VNASDTAPGDRASSTGAEALAKKTKRARVVSAFGTVPSEVLFDVFDAKRKTRRLPSLLYCGNNEDAKNVVAQLIHDVGFEPVDAGPLRSTAACAAAWASAALVTSSFTASRLLDAPRTLDTRLRARTDRHAASSPAPMPSPPPSRRSLI